MKTWRIPVVYQMWGLVEVEADTLEKAIEFARDEDSPIPLPYDAEYLNGSWEVDLDGNVEEIREFYNGDEEVDL